MKSMKLLKKKIIIAMGGIFFLVIMLQVQCVQAETAGTIVVTTTEDVVDDSDGETSLREALAEAKDGDTITFDDALFDEGENGSITITLKSGLIYGGLDDETESDKAIAIEGRIDSSGCPLVTISGDGKYRVLNNKGTGCLTLYGLIIRGGKAEEENVRRYGGGVMAGAGDLVIINCVLRDNAAEGSLINLGGGAYSYGSTTIENSTITDNQSESGGGVYSYGSMTVTNSTITDNQAVLGGGVYSYDSMTVTNSTIADNQANYGSGVYSYDSMTVTNSTIADNQANYSGGIYIYNGDIYMYHSTVAGNTGTGIYLYIHRSGNAYLYNSIVAGNESEQINRTAGELSGSNIIEDDRSVVFGKNVPVDGYLMPKTYDEVKAASVLTQSGLMTGELSVDELFEILEYDQAGNKRGDTYCTYGAVEMTGVSLQVTSEIDDHHTEGTLRAAIKNADMDDGADERIITFADGVSKIQLYYGEIAFGNDLTIKGRTDSAGNPDVTIISTGSTRVFYHMREGTLNLYGVKLQGGNARGSGRGSGGAVHAKGSVTVDNCAITGNMAGGSSGGNGGGIFAGDSIVVKNSTVTDNEAVNSGGGLYADGTITMLNSIVSDNGADYSGGGIFAGTAVYTYHSTISDNIAGVSGGGLYTVSSLSLYNSVVAGNTGDQYTGTLSEDSTSLIEGRSGVIREAVFGLHTAGSDGLIRMLGGGLADMAAEPLSASIRVADRVEKAEVLGAMKTDLTGAIRSADKVTYGALERAEGRIRELQVESGLKTEYEWNESFDPDTVFTGAKLRVLYENGGQGIISVDSPLVTVEGAEDVNTSIPGSYDVSFKYLKVECQFTITVKKGIATVALTVQPDRVTVGESVTLTAEVMGEAGAAAPAGLVEFYNGSTLLGAADISNGLAVYRTNAFPAGNHSDIIARYKGDNNYKDTDSQKAGITVDKGQPILTLTAQADPYPTDTITLTAALTGAYQAENPKIHFELDDINIGSADTDAAGAAIFIYTVTNDERMKFDFTASFAGDSNNKPAVTSGLVFDLEKGSQSIAFETAGTVEMTYAPDFIYRNIAAGGTGAGTITYAFADGGTGEAVINPNTGEITGVKKSGTFIIGAVKAADDYYNEAQTSYMLNIRKAEQGKVSIEQGDMRIALGERTVQLELDGKGSGTGAITWQSSAPHIAEVNSDGLVTLKSGGEVKIAAVRAGDDNYNQAASEAITINVVDKTNLTDMINKAKQQLSGAVIGLRNGDYPKPAADALEQAIKTAEAVRDNRDILQAGLNQAESVLKTAMETFQGAQIVVDYKTLISLIEAAKQIKASASIGMESGQYPASAVTKLQAAIDAAQLVAADSYLTQDEVDKAVQNLSSAIKMFRDSVIAEKKTIQAPKKSDDSDKASKTGSPATGDTHLFPLIVVFLISFAVILFHALLWGNEFFTKKNKAGI